MPSRTTLLVIAIVGLVAFIVGGGVALMDDGDSTPSPSDPTAVTASSPASPATSPSVVPSGSPDEHGDEGNDNHHGGNEDEQSEEGEGD